MGHLPASSQEVIGAHRFGNAFLEPLLHRDHVSSVTITFKEDFGTQGRGGYFDNYGIIRDIMQVTAEVAHYCKLSSRLLSESFDASAYSGGHGTTSYSEL